MPGSDGIDRPPGDKSLKAVIRADLDAAFTARLELGKISVPLGAAQTLAIETPDCAEQLFRDLGGVLADSVSFCRMVKKLASQRTGEAQARAAREAFGSLGEPPRLILQQLLSARGLNLAEMRDPLSQRIRVTSNGFGTR